MLRYIIDTHESSHDRIQIFAREKEEVKFQQFAYVNYKLDEVIYLFDVMISIHDKLNGTQSICNLLRR